MKQRKHCRFKDGGGGARLFSSPKVIIILQLSGVCSVFASWFLCWGTSICFPGRISVADAVTCTAWRHSRLRRAERCWPEPEAWLLPVESSAAARPVLVALGCSRPLRWQGRRRSRSDPFHCSAVCAWTENAALNQWGKTCSFHLPTFEVAIKSNLVFLYFYRIDLKAEFSS